MTPALEQVRARLVEDLRRAKDLGHTVQAWKIKATLAGFDMAVDVVRGEGRPNTEALADAAIRVEAFGRRYGINVQNTDFEIFARKCGDIIRGAS